MKNQISARQLCVAGFTGVLSLSAAAARVDWRGALLAVPVISLAAWAAASAGAETKGLLRAGGGKLFATLYIVFGLFTAGTALALCGERFGATVTQNGAFWPTIIAIIPALWLARGKPEAFARSAEILYLAMLAVSAFVLVLGVGQVESGWLLANEEDIWSSFLTAAGIGGIGIYSILLWNGAEEAENWRFFRWTAAGGLVLAGCAALTAGSLSSALAVQVERPFFVMTVGLSRTARTEALLSALWLCADSALLGLLLQSCRGLWRDVLLQPGEQAVGTVFALAALAVALVEQAVPGLPERLLYYILPVGGVIFGVATPVLLWLLRKRGKQGLYLAE